MRKMSIGGALRRWLAARMWVAMMAALALAGCPDSTGSGLSQGDEGGFNLPDTDGAGDVGGDAADGADAGDAADDGVSVDVDTGAECTSAVDCPVPPTACEIAVCNADGTCGRVNAPNGAACDDGDACTVPDACDEGVCVSGANVCANCATAPDGAPCDDGDACTQGETCQGGTCGGGAAVGCPVSGPCMEPVCDAVKGCSETPAPNDTACNDGQACTTGDVCSDGACVGGTNTCVCTEDTDCAAFQTNKCDAPLACDNGFCVASGEPIQCEQPADPCIQVLCDPADGLCKAIPTTEGTPCDSGIPCAPGSCVAGECNAPPGDPCDDGNPCTKDACADGACENTIAEGDPCDDGNPCTDGDTCDDAGVCGSGLGICQCVTSADCQGDDYDPCLGEWGCLDNNCVPGTPVDCTALDGACAVGVCADGACTAEVLADGAPCDDGNACTEATLCAAGVCEAGASKVCDDGNPCTADGCDPAQGCTATPLDNTACDDGNACTVGDACSGGVCAGTGAVVCPPAGPCQMATCVPDSGCTTEPAAAGVPCDDGDQCTTEDLCDGGGACVGTPQCDCTIAADCPDDGDLCNGVPACTPDGKCVTDPASVVDCATGDPCLVGMCDPGTGMCTSTPAMAGTPCDGGPCVSGGTCDGTGSCFGFGLMCDDGNACTSDACDPGTGQCVYQPLDGAACDDGDPCSVGEVCAAGSCVGGAPNPCNDNDPCTQDGCLPGVGCTNVNACDDNDPCTDDSCDATSGTCLNTPKDCSTGDQCILGSCNPTDGTCAIQFAPGGTACDDGDPCTAGDACSVGTCSGVPDPFCGVDPQCEGVQEGTPCDDGSAATLGDFCLQGQCAGFRQVSDNTLGSQFIQYRYTRVGRFGSDWFIGRQQYGNTFPDDYGGALLDANDPDAPAAIPTATVSGDFFRDIQTGMALTYNGQLFVRGGAGWSNAHPLSTALAASGTTTAARQLWAFDDGVSTTVWVAGSDGEQYIRRCVSGMLVQPQCTAQTLTSPVWTTWRPMAMRGAVQCDAVGGNCTPTLVMAADGEIQFGPGQGDFLNSVFDNVGGQQSPWNNAYEDFGPSTTQVTDIAVMPNTAALMVGTGGFMRFRAADGSVGLMFNNVVPNQGSMTLTGVWVGAGAWIVSGYRDLNNGTRQNVVLVAPMGANLTNAASWNSFVVGTDLQFAAGLFDIWGDNNGQLRGVGAVYNGTAISQPTQWVREP